MPVPDRPKISAPREKPPPPPPDDPTVDIPVVVEPPPVPLDRLIPDGDGYIELDEDGIPLGRWEWSPDDEVWLFEQFPPLAELPQTGLLRWPIPVLLSAGLLMTAFGAVLVKRPGEQQEG